MTISANRHWRGMAGIALVIAVASSAAFTSGAQAGVAGQPPEDWSGALPGFTAVRVGAAGGTVAAGSIPTASGGVPVSVYLPPGFSWKNSYPVVYLVRGIGSASGLAVSIGLPDDADTLIAQGKVPAFLSVTATVAPKRLNDKTVLGGVAGWIEARLPTAPTRAGRTLVGIGTAATTVTEIGLRHPDTFGAVEAWSGRFEPTSALLAVARMQAARLRTLGTRVYLSLGSSDDATMTRGTRAFADLLSDLRVHHELRIGLGRSGPDYWRSQLAPALGFALTVRAGDARVIERTSFVAAQPPRAARSKSPLAYGYPIKPFHRQHPIRGNFGDPRTISTSELGETTAASQGSFTFHNGIDISATTGQAVYPVVSGIAKVKSSDWVSVWTRDGRVFQYFHLKPSVRTNQAVTAERTVLGHVLPHVNHVHLAEIDGSVVHNPTDPGHLEPYTDHTAPFVNDVSFSSTSGRPLDPGHLRGRVLIAASAADTPPIPVPGNWLGFPVTPALVSWRLTSSTGRVVRPERVVADFRRTEPANRNFWTTYADGTFQNFPIFASHYYLGQAGQYRFELTPTALDTRDLPDGRYTLTVDVADVRGNRGSLSETVSIANRPAL